MTQNTRGAVKNQISNGFDALDVRVGTLEGEIQEIKASVSSLRSDIEAGMSGLARDFRSALDSLTSQLTERSKTPWSVIFAGAAVSVTVIALIGQLSLSPLSSQINEIKGQIVPRFEHERAWASFEKRFETNETWLRRNDQQRYDEMVRLIDRLHKENDEAARRAYEAKR